MTERIVEANGVELCVETFGDPADPAILLIHGVGSTMLSWDEAFCERLTGRHVIRYDLRDSGRSVTGPVGEVDYTLRDLVADAVGLLDALDIERAHLVGMSGGAAIAQLVALDHPERVASLTLASATPGIPGEEAGDLPPPTVAYEEAPKDDWVEYVAAAERPYSPHFDEQAARALAERIVARARDIEASTTNPYLAEPGPPWRARLGEIAAPTLVIHGADDPMFPLAHAEALAREIPGAELLALPETGHEYFPPATWDVVVPALLRHSQR